MAATRYLGRTDHAKKAKVAPPSVRGLRETADDIALVK